MFITIQICTFTGAIHRLDKGIRDQTALGVQQKLPSTFAIRNAEQITANLMEQNKQLKPFDDTCGELDRNGG